MNRICKICTAAAAAIIACCDTAYPEDTSQRVFSPDIFSLKVSNPDNFMAPPIMRLGSDDRIAVSFDIQAYDKEDLCATLTHCNADWQPSVLQDSEFLDSFNYEEIEDFGFSNNTFRHYVNYRLELPSEHLRPTRSGNYLLKIAPHDAPDDTLLQIRFQVAEPATTVTGTCTTRTDRGTNAEWQQLETEVDLRQLKVSNPYSDIIVKVSQNGVPQSRRTLTTPLRVDGNRLIYAHRPELIFPALNEYRRFETVRAGFPGLGVDSVRFDNNRYHAFLTVDADRSEHEYVYDQTQRGRFLIREYNSTDSDLAADYIDVHFTLDFPEIFDADVYVEGEMTGYRHDASTRMAYDHNDRVYRLAMPLKQGSYNYRYTVAKRDGNGNSESSMSFPETIEGNHWETVNEYSVEVYYRPPGERADRLIGYATIISNSSKNRP